MKKQNDPVKTAKRLHILWWLTYIPLSQIALFRKTSMIVQTGSYPWEPFSDGFQLFMLLSVVLWFLPLMVKIRRLAKVSQMRRTLAFSTFLLAVMTFWTPLAVLAAFFPT